LTLQLATVFILRADDIGEVAFRRVNREATAFSPDGRVRLQAGGILLYVPYLDGTPTRGDLLVVFDPTTKHYLWRERTHSPRGAFNLELLNGLAGNPWRAFFSSTDSITWWHAWNTDIEVQTSTDVAKDLDDALARALSELRDGWDAHYSKAECPNCRKVDFGEGVDATFWVDPFAVSAAPANLLPRIEDINLVDHGYRIRLSNRRTKSLPRLATALDAYGAQCRPGVKFLGDGARNGLRDQVRSYQQRTCRQIAASLK
jgi:hypothetical protein